MNVMRFGLVLAAGVCFMLSPVRAGDECTCKQIAKDGQGWCKGCNDGEIYGVKLTSEKLYTVLAGKAFDASKSPCKGCQEAAKNNGTCDHCKASIANGYMFHSKVAHTLAAGQSINAEPVKGKLAACPNCKKSSENAGYCTGCDVGIIGGRMYKTMAVFEVAVKAHQLVEKASKEKCESCGVAMVDDGTCDHCKKTFKNGEPVKA